LVVPVGAVGTVASPTLPTADTPEVKMTHRPEMLSESGMDLPSLGRALRLFGRASLLHCPHCGKGPVLAHWLKLRVKCGTCGLRLQRGEYDAFTGSMFILFNLVSLLGYLVIVLTLAMTKETPWDLLQYGLPVLALVLVVVLFPFGRLLWLALDLTLRPVTPAELEWHRAADAEFETERDAPR
jgi:uncharacterized protein (DUF983 family)